MCTAKHCARHTDALVAWSDTWLTADEARASRAEAAESH